MCALAQSRCSEAKYFEKSQFLRQLVFFERERNIGTHDAGVVNAVDIVVVVNAVDVVVGGGVIVVDVVTIGCSIASCKLQIFISVFAATSTHFREILIGTF